MANVSLGVAGTVALSAAAALCALVLLPAALAFSDRVVLGRDATRHQKLLLFVLALLFSAPALALIRNSLILRRSLRVILRPDGKYGNAELNERLVYDATAVLLLPWIYCAIDVFGQRRAIALSKVHRKWQVAMTTAAPSILGRSLRLGVFFSSIYHIFFTLVFRRPIYNVLSGIAMLFFEISTTDPVVRVGFFDFRNFLDLTLSTVFIILLWETMSTAIETTYSMPLDLDNDPSRVSLLLLTLKNSSKSSSYEQMLAFMDLLRLATCSNPRSREQLFNGTGAFESSSISNSSSSTNSSITVGDASKTGTSSAEWIEIAAACLDRINKLQKTLVEIQEQNANSDGNNRKNEKGGASVLKRSSSSGITSLKLQGAAAAAAVGSATPSPIKKMKLLTGAVKPSPVKRDVVGSFLDALQEDGAINVDKTGIQVGGPNGLYKVGGGGSKKDITGRGWIDGLVGGFSSGSKGDKKNAIGKRGMRKLTSDAFEDYQIIALAIQSVAKLLIAGTKEDKYGSVQRDIPVVLESLINCLVAVETHIAKPAGPLEGGNQYGSIVLREPLAMIHVLQTNVYFITTNLGDHLARYKFEPNVANKLKRFIDYLE